MSVFFYAAVATSSSIFLLVESFSGLFQFFVHGEEFLDSGVLLRVFADEEDDVLDLDATGAPDLHALVCRFRNELDQQIL